MSVVSAADQHVYDDRYRGAYRQHVAGYEAARWTALERTLRSLLIEGRVSRVIDYGCGNGLFTPLLSERWPDADISGADISAVALEGFRRRLRAGEDRAMHIRDDRVDAPDGSFDVAMAVEVLEHVRDLGATLREVVRLLRPGGVFIWTTPCANAGSLEHAVAHLSGRVGRSETGERRWTWEDPTHLRRLTTGEAKRAARDAGFRSVKVRCRAHAMSYLATPLVGGRWTKLAETLMDAEHRWLRWLPTGASMIGVARK